MPLLRVPEAVDHPDWLFELKHDGFRAFAVIERYTCRLISRGGHVLAQWPYLNEELAPAVRADRAVLDGEVTCLRPDGRSDVYGLLLRREWPVFFAFDALTIEGEDLRGLTLLERKARLREVMPRTDVTRLRYVDQVAQGAGLFRLACARDTEGVVGKWAHGRYHTDGRTTSWLKVKNPAYSQMEGRRELFESRRGGSRAAVQASYHLDALLRTRPPAAAERH